jgi:hypothetical protein
MHFGNGAEKQNANQEAARVKEFKERKSRGRTPSVSGAAPPPVGTDCDFSVCFQHRRPLSQKKGPCQHQKKACKNRFFSQEAVWRQGPCAKLL